LTSIREQHNHDKQQLNASIAVEGLDAKKVAADYLKKKGWTK